MSSVVPHPARQLPVAGVDTFFYDVGSGDVPVICVHGNPDSADTWLPLLDRTAELGRVIAPDLPGFGRSERPDPYVFDSSVDAYVDWFGELVDALGVDRYRLVVHDWGSLALAAASWRPEQLERLVAIDVVPLSTDYRWHWIARLLWRPPVVGELGMAITGRRVVKLLTRLQRPRFAPLGAGHLDRVGRDLDPGMKRAILALYRSADPVTLGVHSARLGDVTAPALLLWGADDPYVRVEEMAVLRDALGGAVEARTVPGGHWPMFDTDEVFDAAIAFLTGPAAPAAA